MGTVDKIIAMILLEAKDNESKLGLVSDIYRVSSDIDRKLIDIMHNLREEERRNSK